MTSEVPEVGAKSGRDKLWWVTTTTGTLVVLLLIYLVVLIPTGTNVIPWGKDQKSSGQGSMTASGTVADLQNAINKELTAYYGFDYRTIDTAIATVAAGSTGVFKTKIQGLAQTLKEGAAQLKTVSSAEIQQIAVHQLQGTKASALAVVNQTMSNAETANNKASATCKARFVCNVYHLLATYELVAGQWKLSDLEYWQ